MTQLTDEMLVAYVDGELSPEEAAEIERALQSDRKVREAVNVFRESADWSRRAFDDVLREPVPERLIQAATGQGSIDRIADAQPIAAPGRQSGLRRSGLAMAASIALAIGIAGGFGLSGLVAPGQPAPNGLLLVGTVDHGDGLHTALESTASGTLTEIADAGDVMPLSTFVESNGRYCREFQATLAGTAGSNAAFGIACRQPVGSWHVEAIVAAPNQTAAQSNNFIPADGAGDPLRPLVDAMSASAPISLADEAAVLATEWK